MTPAVGQLWFANGRLFRVESLLVDAEYDRADLVEVARDTLTTNQERDVIARRLEASPQLAMRLAVFDADCMFEVDSNWFALAPKWPDRGHWAGSADSWLASRAARAQSGARR